MSGAALALAAALFFDDFAQPDLEALRRSGWVLRQGAGHPGPAGARWEPGLLRLLDDPAQSGNRLLRLQAATDGSGEGTQQSQLCHRRQYLEGSYAARVRFSNAPLQGADGDPVIQAHYLISPLRHDLDPLFSEADFEYLANGGWGSEATRLYAINWQTVRMEPWQSFNQAHERPGVLEGWHVLAMQIGAGRTRLYLDGTLLAEHGGRNQPVQPMSLNFSLWFSPTGLLGREAGTRHYAMDVDWVLHAQDELLSPAQLLERVAELRRQGVTQRDSVRPPEPEPDSPCNL